MLATCRCAAVRRRRIDLRVWSPLITTPLHSGHRKQIRKLIIKMPVCNESDIVQAGVVTEWQTRAEPQPYTCDSGRLGLGLGLGLTLTLTPTLYV